MRWDRPEVVVILMMVIWTTSATTTTTTTTTQNEVKLILNDSLDNKVGDSSFTVKTINTNNGKNFMMKEENEFFSVNLDGTLNIKKKWDFKTLGNDKTIQFTVLYKNLITSRYEDYKVIIKINNDDDERPHFITRAESMQTILSPMALTQPNYKVYKFNAIYQPDLNIPVNYKMQNLQTVNYFIVDEKTGEVRVNGRQNFIIGDEYIVSVKAVVYDNKKNQLISSDKHDLSIIIGNRPPQFIFDKYDIQIPEDQPKDKTIITINAFSFYSSQSSIKYELKTQNSKSDEFFIINKNTGEVKLIKDLDYDDINQLKEHDLKIIATDIYASNNDPKSSSVDLKIKIIDVNDNYPNFEIPEYQIRNIDEDVPIGTNILRVIAKDIDSYENGIIEYYLTDDNFSIDDDGIIRNIKILDADYNKGLYHFDVIAYNPNDLNKNSSTIVKISTNNKNDEAPQFSKNNFTSNIDENANANTFVTTIIASDIDNDNIIYTFDNNNKISGPFEINPISGIIRLNNNHKTFDKEIYILNVTASDDGSCCKNGKLKIHKNIIQVYVFITDINDHKPVFDNCTMYTMYPPSVYESQPIGTSVITVVATDKDIGINKLLKYEIVYNDETEKLKDKFIIDENTGEIKTNAVLDRENLKEIPITVSAIDSGKQPLEGFCSFKIQINDINDNSPYFIKQKTVFSIKHSSSINTTIGRVVAKDDDVGNNSLINYILLENDDSKYFNVNIETGTITLKKLFDTSQNEYNIKINATDRNMESYSTTAKVKISVVEDYKKWPSWLPSNKSVTIKENYPLNTPIITLTAISGMENSNRLTFAIVSGDDDTEKFQFVKHPKLNNDNSTSIDIMLINQVHCEKRSNYTLTIEATNDNDISISTTIDIFIEDTNDKRPMFIFDHNSRIPSVRENQPNNTFIFQIKASDDDVVSPNNLLTYKIIKQDESGFRINETTGEIYTNKIFDHEKGSKNSQIVEVLITDGAPSVDPAVKGPNYNHHEFRVEIADENDNPPSFNNTLYIGQVEENADRNKIVMQVFATDPDQSDKIYYEIIDGNSSGAFDIISETGEIYVSGTIDYESKKQYNLTVRASDTLSNTVSTVIINVIDKNDNPPIFDQSNYTVYITEEDNKNIPRLLLNVSTSDNDKNRPQNHSFFIKNNKFEIKKINGSTASIYILDKFDRDIPGQPRLHLTVYAEDEDGIDGSIGTADITINIKDINDNSPYFDPIIVDGYVKENSSAGIIIKTMTAFDIDDPLEGENAKLTYYISKNICNNKTNECLFDIDPTSGQITTAVSYLDYETTHDYKIEVIAQDGDKRQGTGTASIHIIDINDMPPKFTNETWYVTVNETDKINLPKSSILTVTVEDEDQKENNIFEYKIIDNKNNGGDRFSISTNKDGTGSLKIKKYLDYENEIHKKGFKFRIQVSDKGMNDDDNYHVAYSWVNVTILDKNDNKPIFDKSITLFNVSENINIGETFGAKFTATDPDNNGKNNITYHINGKNYFQINNNGIVTVTRKLDREKESIHYVSILAIDNDIPILTATTTLTVNVIDVNDNAPRLRETQVVLKENLPPTKNIITLTAIDDDDESKGNGPPFIFNMDESASYEIKNSFNVVYENKNDGIAIVSSLKKFDRETKKEYYIPIVISDNGIPKMTGTSTLTVIIGDDNDNPMSYGKKNILIYQYDDKPIDTDIGKVYVNDLDDWDTDKTFILKNEFNYPEFTVSKDTGIIKMKLNTTTSNHHLLNFDVKDYQTTVTADVTVDIKKITYEAIINSGSMRISGVTYDNFIKSDNGKSKIDLFKEKLSILLNVNEYNIDVFTVQQQQQNPLNTDIRFSVKNPFDITKEKLTNSEHEHGLIYYQPVKLNGIVSMYREELEKYLGINILMVGINECLNNPCDGSCTNRLDISDTPYVVDMNSTSLIGVHVNVIPECICDAQNLNKKSTCETIHCYNGARCIENEYGGKCECPPGYDGPRCQLTTRSFKGQGWAWYPSFELCENNHLSFEFITNYLNGQLLYNGPVGALNLNSLDTSDFISIELIDGLPKLLINYGKKIIELSIEHTNEKLLLNDGEWHRLDVIWNYDYVELIVDMCKRDKSSCYQRTSVSYINEYLNINGPLQIGGLNIMDNTIDDNKWNKSLKSIGFNGCIKNIIFNSKIYDLGLPGLSKESWPGCSQIDDICNKYYSNKCWEHGSCVGTFTKPKCQCDDGWHGMYCDEKTTPSTFNENSYVKYELSFTPNNYSTNIQLNFRTRQINGELIRLNDERKFKYAVIEIVDSYLLFRFNLNDNIFNEHKIWLSEIKISDGQWHTVKVSRYGLTCIIELDGGEGLKYNETIIFDKQENFVIDQMKGVHVGGVEPTNDFEIYGNFEKGCINDIRLDDRHLPLPPEFIKNSHASVKSFKNVVTQCYDNKKCKNNIICQSPYQCIDTWNDHECTCEIGKELTSNNTYCIDKNECLNHPCLNDGKCINNDSPMIYKCNCLNNFIGHNCELIDLPKDWFLIKMGKLPTFLIILFFSILMFLILVIVIKKKDKKQVMDTEMIQLTSDKSSICDSEAEDKVINEKNDEDIQSIPTILPQNIQEVEQPIPISQTPTIKKTQPPAEYTTLNIEPLPPGVGDFIDERMTNTEPLLAPDNTIKYAYEGDGNSVGSLSSLSTDGETDELTSMIPNEPKFDELADILDEHDGRVLHAHYV